MPKTGQIHHTLERWAACARREVLVLYLAARDPRVPWLAKLVAAAAVAYALSPIDLIPDFIPVIGYLDDLILLPLLLLLAVRLIRVDVMRELRAEADRRLDTPLPKNRRAAAVIIAIWLVGSLCLTAVLLSWWLRK